MLRHGNQTKLAVKAHQKISSLRQLKKSRPLRRSAYGHVADVSKLDEA